MDVSMNETTFKDSETSTYVDDRDTNNLVDTPARTQNRHRGYYIEPVIFLMSLASGLFDTVVTNVIEAQYCTAVLSRPAFDCSVNSTSVPQADIQRFTSNFQLIRTSVEVTIPCILSFFLGPWSDKYGRRPLLISATIGFFINNALWTWGSNVPALNPMFFIAFSLPYAFCGGVTFLYLCSFCYVCDITPIEKRSTRLGLVQASILLGTLAGVQLCPLINNKLGGYSVIFSVGAAISYLSLMYAYFILPESITPSEIDLNAESRNPFNLSHIRDLIDACYIKQTPVNRLKITIVMMILTVSLIQISGESQITYLFLQRILKISLKNYTILISYSITIGATAAYVIPRVFSQYFQVDELHLMSLSVFPRILAALTIVFGFREWHIYFSRTLNCTLGLTGPLARSYLSRIVHEDQLGKVFSLMASAESSTPLFGSLAYTFIYNWTVSPFPEAVFLFSGFLLILQLLLITLLIELHLSRPGTKEPRLTAGEPSINA